MKVFVFGDVFYAWFSVGIAFVDIYYFTVTEIGSSVRKYLWACICMHADGRLRMSLLNTFTTCAFVLMFPSFYLFIHST